jgi:isopenicillin N synthase-like dioxygenase
VITGSDKVHCQGLFPHGVARFHPDSGLAESVVEVERIARALFSQPTDIKRACMSPETDYQSGWRAATASHRPDEVWHVRHADPAATWPAALVGARPPLLALLDAAVAVGTEFLREAIEAAGGDELPALDFASSSTLRLLHYAPSARDWRFGAHTDLGLMTLFLTESSPGLEVRLPDRSWQPAEPRADSWVVAGGEMLGKMTSRRAIACLHRVRRCATDRYAMAVFLHPPPDFVLRLEEEGPLTAGDFFRATMEVRKRRLAPR